MRPNMIKLFLVLATVSVLAAFITKFIAGGKFFQVSPCGLLVFANTCLLLALCLKFLE